MGVLFSILFIMIGIVIVLVLIMLHELGHFIFAKISKAYVFEFAIGFGPRILTFKTKETWYSIRLLPLGGFVSIASDFAEPPTGRENEFALIPDHRKIDYIVKWKKTIFILAGPLVNLFVAFILIMSVFLSNGYKPNDMNFYGQRFTQNSIALNLIQKQEPSFNYDSQSVVITSMKLKINNDEEIKTNEIKTYKYLEIVTEMSNALKETNKKLSNGDLAIDSLQLSFNYILLANNYSNQQKEGSSLKTTEYQIIDDQTIQGWKDNKKISIGIQPPHRYFKNSGAAFGYSFVETWNQSVLLITGLGRFFTGDFNAISGPLGMFNGSGDSTGIQTNYVLYVASISANLFMLNALPFPPLDGYKFWETLVEWITKKEVNKKVKIVIYITGALFLLALMIVVTIKDIII